MHALVPEQRSSLRCLFLGTLSPPCPTLARNCPHGHFLFYDILMSERHQSLQIRCPYVLSPALKMCGLEVAVSKSLTWQAQITAGAHHRLET